MFTRNSINNVATVVTMLAHNIPKSIPTTENSSTAICQHPKWNLCPSLVIPRETPKNCFVIGRKITLSNYKSIDNSII